MLNDCETVTYVCPIGEETIVYLTNGSVITKLAQLMFIVTGAMETHFEQSVAYCRKFHQERR